MFLAFRIYAISDDSEVPLTADYFRAPDHHPRGVAGMAPCREVSGR